MVVKDIKFVIVICEGIYEVNKEFILFVLLGSEMVNVVNNVGLKVVMEVFVDRVYEEDGILVVRIKEGLMIIDEDEFIKRVIRMIKENKVKMIIGIDILIKVDFICVYGDGIKVLEFVRKIKVGLEE